MAFEKQLVRKVARAVKEFDMIRGGDKIAVGVSGGKDSLALLGALHTLHRHSPVSFELHAFTIEQGKFVRPIEPLGDYMEKLGIPWTYYRDAPSFRLIEEQPEHGCDSCSRYRRRAVYEVANALGANVVALGHTADDLCESLLRNALYTGRLGALPASTKSRAGNIRLIRPLVYVSEEITSGYVEENGIPVTPCVCSFKTGTVRESIRDFLQKTKQGNPHVMDNLIAAMGRIDPNRLLDKRFIDPDAEGDDSATLADCPSDLIPVETLETI
jgi:tRNA 2-thiocytidine biosynthesis protein TtcA